MFAPAATVAFSLAREQPATEDGDPTCYVTRSASSSAVAARFAACGSNGFARVFDANCAGLSASFSVAAAQPGALADVALPGPATLATLRSDGVVSLWDARAPPPAATEAAAALTMRSTGAGDVNCIAASGDGRLIAVGHGSQVCVLDTAAPRRPLARYEEAHTDDVTHVAFHPLAHAQLLSGSLDGLVCVLDTSAAPGTEAGDDGDALLAVLSVGHPVETFAIVGAAASTLAVSTCDEHFSLWSIAADASAGGAPGALVAVDGVQQRLSVPALGYSADHVVGAAFAPAIHALAVFTSNATGAVGIHALDGHGAFAPPAVHAPSESRGHVALVRTLAASPDGSVVLTGGEDARVCLWTAASATAAAAAVAPTADASPTAESSTKHALRNSTAPYARR